MTSKELIDRLGQFDREAEVLVYYEQNGKCYEIENVDEALEDDPPGSAIIYVRERYLNH